MAFVRDHPRIRLRLFASRLYFHWLGKYQEGLRLLHASGIPVTIMNIPGRERAEGSGGRRVCSSKDGNATGGEG